MTFIDGIVGTVLKMLPYFGVLVGSLILSLTLTPLVRKINSRLGMVDVPGGRRINKRPVARGGGVAVIASFVLSMSVFAFFAKGPVSPAFRDSVFVVSVGSVGIRAAIACAGVLCVLPPKGISTEPAPIEPSNLSTRPLRLAVFRSEAISLRLLYTGLPNTERSFFVTSISVCLLAPLVLRNSLDRSAIVCPFHVITIRASSVTTAT